MCGVVGCIGHDRIQIVLNGLEKLEYRGYDSAGLFIVDSEDGPTQLVKRVGRIQNLRDAVDDIFQHKVGHTRWATRTSDRKQRSPSPITIRSFHISAQRRNRKL